MSGDDEPAPGTMLGRYQVLARLGHGAMGVVYAALDPELDRKVAIKLLRRDDGAGAWDRERQRRLLREAQAMARLSHPNVVAVHDVGYVDERIFLAMELIDGVTLAAWLAAARRGVDEIVAIFRRAGRGLAALHAAGLVHRDFKPDNVMVSQDGRVLVMDLGLVGGEDMSEEAQPAVAGSPVATDPRLTEPGMAVGTPAYMAPEQHAAGRIDARTDQFAFCVALWEALYGEAPFAGASWAELAREVVAGRLRRPTRTRARAPGRVLKVLVRGLRANPDDRYPTMDALLADLARGPWVTRTRLLLGGAALVVAALVATSLGGRRGPAPPVCATGRSRLIGVWDEGRKQAMAAAFAATGRPYAGPTVKLATATLDDYAAAWSTQYGEACAATWVRHEQSYALLDRRMQCLEERRDALRALGDLFAGADEDVVRTAIDAAAALPPVASCADPRALGARAAPADPVTAVAVSGQRARIATAWALGEAGKYPAALALATQVVAAARPLGHAPLVAEALKALGSAQDSAGDAHAAEATLEEALTTAEACGDDEVASQVLANLAWVVGHGQGRHDEGHQRARHAEALIQRRGGDDNLEASVRQIDGSLYLEQADYVRARAELEHARELATRAHGPEHRDVALITDTLAQLYSAQGRYAEALPLEERALALRARAYGVDHPTYATALNNVGVSLAALGRLDEALDHHRRALAIRVATLPPDHPHLADSYANLALVLAERGQYAEARAAFEHALAIREKALGAEHPRIADLVDYIGTTYLAQGKFAEALPYFQRGLAIVEKTLGAKHPLAAEMENGIGQALVGLGRLAEAVPPLERAVALREASPGDAAELADTRFALARALLPSDRARARALATQAADGFRSAGPRGAAALPEVEAWLKAAGH